MKVQNVLVSITFLTSACFVKLQVIFMFGSFDKVPGSGIIKCYQKVTEVEVGFSNCLLNSKLLCYHFVAETLLKLFGKLLCSFTYILLSLATILKAQLRQHV